MGVCGWAPQAKEERLAEEKAKKKAAAKKMGEVEARRRQEDEARRLRWLQQVRTPGSRSRRTALPPCPWTAGLTPLCRVDRSQRTNQDCPAAMEKGGPCGFCHKAG